MRTPTNTAEALREEPRYEIAGDQAVQLVVEPTDHRAQPLTLSGRLMNLSASGAKLAVAAQLPPHKTLRLRMRIESMSLELYVSANVCWASHGGADQCILGCRLSPRLPPGMLSHLTAGGRLDRRDSARESQLRTLRVVRDRVAGGAAQSATVHNYSRGGLCLEATTPARIGERIGIVLDQPSKPAIQVVARWQLQQGNRCIIGCGYAEADTFERLEQAWQASMPAAS
jgi:hypothetical protein